MLNFSEQNLFNKTILIRTDFNVPMHNGKITSDARIIQAIPTINFAIKQKAKIILMSHLGRPKEGIFDKQFSLFPIFQYLEKNFFKNKIYFQNDYAKTITLKPGQICLLENVRFNIGETNNCNILANNYSKLCDIFVMDAFGSAHRKHASTYGICKFAKLACAGLLLIKETQALNKIFKNPTQPIVVIIGGSKISTKFNLIDKLGKLANTIIVGGGIANTFIAIKNNIGKSLHEKNFISLAKKLANQYNILIPVDSRIKNHFNNSVIIKNTTDINSEDEIMDIGDKTANLASQIINDAKTIIWNGPVGVFENPKFRKGTQMIANSIANCSGFSIAGGGDTLSAINMFHIQDKISYISTGGGAFLEFLEKKTLPALQILDTIHSTKKQEIRNTKKNYDTN